MKRAHEARANVLILIRFMLNYVTAYVKLILNVSASAVLSFNSEYGIPTIISSQLNPLSHWQCCFS